MIKRNKIKITNKNKLLLVSSIILFSISLSLLIAGLYVISLPKNIMLLDMSNITNGLQDCLNNNSILKTFIKDNESISLTSKLALTADNIPSLPYKNLYINSTYNEDEKNKISYLKTNINADGTILLDIEEYLANNNMYLSSTNITDGFLSIPYNYISIFDKSSINNEDYSKLIKIINESIEKNTNNSDIVKTKELITINNKEIKVTKLSYLITNKILYSYIKEIIEQASLDPEVTSLLAKMTSMTVEEVNNEYKTILKSIESIKDSETPIMTYNVYYKGFNNVIMSEIENSGIISSYYRENDIKQFNLYDQATKTSYFSLNINKNVVEGTILSMIDYKGTYNFDNNKEINLNFVSKADQTENVDLKLKYVETKLSKEVNQELSIDLDINLAKTLSIDTTVNLELENKYTSIDSIDISSLKNARNMSELTDSEFQTTYQLAKENPVLSLLIKEYEKKI